MGGADGAYKTKMTGRNGLEDGVLVEPAGQGQPGLSPDASPRHGLAGWIAVIAQVFRRIYRMRVGGDSSARLHHVERIALGPKQALHLVEADGVRLLVATSGEGTPSFFPLAATLSDAPSLEHAGLRSIATGNRFASPRAGNGRERR